MTPPTNSPGLLSYLQLPETFNFVSLHSADALIELLLFVHNDVVTIPNQDRKIVAEIQNVNEGEYYMVHLHWQPKGSTSQRFATASAFIYDNPDEDGCTIQGFAELTAAIPLFGVLLLGIALLVHLVTGMGIITFGMAFVLFVLAIRGALQWRNTLIQQLFHIAQILPYNRWESEIEEEEYDERIELLVKGIKQGA